MIPHEKQNERRETGVETTTNGRIEWIDSVKGVAMISVVLCHVVNGFRKAGLFTNSGGGVLYAIENITDIYQMPLFCLISGFLFSFSYVSRAGELKREKVDRQILNFVGMYVAWSIITYVAKIAFSREVNTELSPWAILFIWCKTIDFLWYLYVLAAIYMIFRFDKVRNAPGCIIFMIMTIAGLVGSALASDFLDGLFCIKLILYYSFIFYIGILLEKRLREGKTFKKMETIVILSMGAVSIGLTVLFWGRKIKDIPIVNLITGLGISFLIVLVFMRVDILHRIKPLNYIGRRSIEIYLIHVFCTVGARPIIRMLGLSNPFLGVAITFLLSIAIPLLIGYVFKRLGLYDFLFRPYTALRQLTNKKES